tara:strand:- start:1402 stop:2157 length:756 start_codon:yes stop_codon:yes gene_type:complete
MKLIDTHSHIYYDKYNNDLPEVLNNAQNKNVSKIICVGVDIETSKKSIQIAEKYDMVYATAGYHPHESKETKSDYLDQLKKLLTHKKVIAVGEMGLDYFYEISDSKIQRKIFREQLDLAKELNMPAIIHNRNSDDDLFNDIKSSGIKKGVIHCFASNLEFANKILDLGLHISFTGMITFVKELQDVVNQIPLNKIMIETDAPYLAPIPYRGKRNEPYMVNFIAEEIAKIKGLTFKEVAKTTTKTARDFFGI